MSLPNEAPSRPLGVRLGQVALVVYLGLSIGLSVYSLSNGLPFNPDWALWTAVPDALERNALYRADAPVPFVWSPVMGWVMAAVVLYVGFWPWAGLHLAAVTLLRDPALILLTLGTWGFWLDLGGGNTFIFVFVAAVLALRGSRAAAYVYLALLMLMPRPVQLPLAAWLLVRMPWTRLPFVAMALIHAIVVLASGYAADWIGAMFTFAPGQHPYDLGPGRWLGPLWLLGLPLAGWLLLKGRVGWAGLAASPYLLPQYLLMPLLDLRRVSSATRTGLVPLPEKGPTSAGASEGG